MPVAFFDPYFGCVTSIYASCHHLYVVREHYAVRVKSVVHIQVANTSDTIADIALCGICGCCAVNAYYQVIETFRYDTVDIKGYAYEVDTSGSLYAGSCNCESDFSGFISCVSEGYMRLGDDEPRVCGLCRVDVFAAKRVKPHIRSGSAMAKLTKVNLKLVACSQYGPVGVVESVGVFTDNDILNVEGLVTNLDFSHSGLDNNRRSKLRDHLNTTVADCGSVYDVVNSAAVHLYIYIAFKVRVSGQEERKLNFSKLASSGIHICNTEAMAVSAEAGVNIAYRSFVVTTCVIGSGNCFVVAQMHASVPVMAIDIAVCYVGDIGVSDLNAGNLYVFKHFTVFVGKGEQRIFLQYPGVKNFFFYNKRTGFLVETSAVKKFNCLCIVVDIPLTANRCGDCLGANVRVNQLRSGSVGTYEVSYATAYEGFRPERIS